MQCKDAKTKKHGSPQRAEVGACTGSTDTQSEARPRLMLEPHMLVESAAAFQGCSSTLQTGRQHADPIQLKQTQSFSPNKLNPSHELLFSTVYQ